jgi:hypothetical protein
VAHQALGAGKGTPLGAVPNDFAPGGAVDPFAGVEINEQQARARIGGEIAQRIEHLVAGEIRHG